MKRDKYYTRYTGQKHELKQFIINQLNLYRNGNFLYVY